MTTWDVFCASWMFIGWAASRNGVAGGEVIEPKFTRVRACSQFVPGAEAKYCRCGFSVHAHTRAARRPVHYCNSCGQEFFGRRNGYSMCSEHAHISTLPLEVNR